MRGLRAINRADEKGEKQREREGDTDGRVERGWPAREEGDSDHCGGREVRRQILHAVPKHGVP